ncbi:hypothetical protein WICMUC_000245 [Wickerhamomyces mucosus]|uniref:Nuclear pore complex protein Nup85 n=1 Tax=Wickerhamomyces mucosus TaxID=1378264 RepID=A0A9P8TJG1_9ASCO|nr:hypothetical protein WICMUC_000245 [Wickerhamomyces mucosus]
MSFSFKPQIQENDKLKPIELMDEHFDFIDSDQDIDQDIDKDIDHIKQDGQLDESKEDEDDEQDIEQEVDPVSNVLLSRFKDAPIPNDGVESWRNHSRILKFKLNPNGIDGIGFISQNPESDKKIKIFNEETKIYTTKIPTFKDSKLYIDYVANLFEIFQELGDDRYYSIQTIGLIRKNSQFEQSQNLKTSFELILTSLQKFIEELAQENYDSLLIFEFEEILNIINCLYSIYFIDNDESEFAINLKNWINQSDPQPSNELSQSILSSLTPFKHPLFWNLVTQLIIRGLYQEAYNVLNDSKIYESIFKQEEISNLYSDILNILKSYPERQTLNFFKEWKNLTIQALDISKSLSNNIKDNIELLREFINILSILSGDKQSIIQNSSNWYECLLALYYYYIPSKELLSEYFELAVSQFQPDVSSIWELSSIDVFHGNFLQVLRSISSFDSTTSSYISVLLEAKGLLKGYSFDSDDKILNQSIYLNQDLFTNTNVSDFLMNSHALDCLSNYELASIGVGILSLSRNPIARSVIAEYLSHYDFQSSDDIEWAFQVCAQLKLNSTAQSLNRIIAHRALNDGRTFDALVHFAKAGEINYVKHYTWLLFEKSLLIGNIVDDEIINSIVDDTVVIDQDLQEIPSIVRQCLTPYAILYQFWKYQQNGSLRLSLLKLISLLKFKYLPLEYFGILLSQLLPFIIFITPSNVFLQNDLYSIIKVLNEFEKNLNSITNNNKIKNKLAKKLKLGEELYQISIKDIETKDKLYWANQLTKIGVRIPNDLNDLIKLVKRNIAVEIGRTFLEGK